MCLSLISKDLATKVNEINLDLSLVDEYTRNYINTKIIKSARNKYISLFLVRFDFAQNTKH